MKTLFIIISLATFITETKLTFSATTKENQSIESRSILSSIENIFISNKDERYQRFVVLTREREDLIAKIQNIKDQLASLEREKNEKYFNISRMRNLIFQSENELSKLKQPSMSMSSAEEISGKSQEIQKRIDESKQTIARLNDESEEISDKINGHPTRF
jgi:peptidoglycan hydrolase CwlO-like protein